MLTLSHGQTLASCENSCLIGETSHSMNHYFLLQTSTVLSAAYKSCLITWYPLNWYLVSKKISLNVIALSIVVACRVQDVCVVNIWALIGCSIHSTGSQQCTRFCAFHSFWQSWIWYSWKQLAARCAPSSLRSLGCVVNKAVSRPTCIQMKCYFLDNLLIWNTSWTTTSMKQESSPGLTHDLVVIKFELHLVSF